QVNNNLNTYKQLENLFLSNWKDEITFDNQKNNPLILTYSEDVLQNLKKYLYSTNEDSSLTSFFYIYYLYYGIQIHVVFKNGEMLGRLLKNKRNFLSIYEIKLE